MKRRNLLALIGIALVMYVFSCQQTFANEITILNVAIPAQNPTTNTISIQFDISWHNSWRDVGATSDSSVSSAKTLNYDAAWIFIKYSIDQGSTWRHATLKATTKNPLNDSLGWSKGNNEAVGDATDIEIIVPITPTPEDRKGAFFQKANENGNTRLSRTGVRFIWDYGTDVGTNTAADTSAATALVKVMAIEMVYIPTGEFYVGDGDGTAQSGTTLQLKTAPPLDTTATSNTFLPVLINTDPKVARGSAVASSDSPGLWTPGISIDGDNGLDTDLDGTIDNASYPTGYKAFYMMKYEISQGQYRDFLNSLTRAEQKNRASSTITAGKYISGSTAGYSIPQFRNGIRAPNPLPSASTPMIFGCDLNNNGIFNESDDGEWIACNFLTWMDVVAYADWAGLRPMSELEFEKAARGPNTPVKGEFAWGSTASTRADTMAVGGAINETATNTGEGLANHNLTTPANYSSADYNSMINFGPLRSGFAAGANTTRSQAGASYYGVMELSGNLYERMVSFGNVSGRAFQGLHGDGQLTTTVGYEGNANQDNAVHTDWPGFDATAARGITGATGSGYRGGYYNVGGTTRLIVSDRASVNTAYVLRTETLGGRLVRTAP